MREPIRPGQEKNGNIPQGKHLEIRREASKSFVVEKYISSKFDQRSSEAAPRDEKDCGHNPTSWGKEIKGKRENCPTGRTNGP